MPCSTRKGRYNARKKRRNARTTRRNDRTMRRNARTTRRNARTTRRNDRTTRRNDRTTRRNDRTMRRNDRTMRRNDRTTRRNDCTMRRNDCTMRRNDRTKRRNARTRRRNARTTRRDARTMRRNDRTMRPSPCTLHRGVVAGRGRGRGLGLRRAVLSWGRFSRKDAKARRGGGGWTCRAVWREGRPVGRVPGWGPRNGFRVHLADAAGLRPNVYPVTMGLATGPGMATKCPPETDEDRPRCLRPSAQCALQTPIKRHSQVGGLFHSVFSLLHLLLKERAKRGAQFT